MAEKDSLASLLGTIIAAAVTALIVWPFIRRKQKIETEEIAKRVGKGGFTPLMYAATVGDTLSLAEILAAGVDINANDDNGETALLHAVNARQHEAIKVLLEAGADAHKPSNEHVTPAQAAQNIGPELHALFQGATSRR